MLSRENTEKILKKTIEMLAAQDIMTNAAAELENNITIAGSKNQLLNDLYNEIFIIRSAIDKNHDIRSCYPSPEQSQNVWARYIDTANFNPKVNNEADLNNYLIIFYTYLIASITITQIYAFPPSTIALLDNIKKTVSDEFHTLLNSSKKNSEIDLLKIISEGKGYIIEVLLAESHFLDKANLDEIPVNSGIKNYLFFDKPLINSMLDQAKDWVSLERPTPSVATVIKFHEAYANCTIIILEQPCTQLSPEQLEEFENLHSKKWFTSLTLFQQQLVLHYKNNIIVGKSVISSQLRRIVPCCVNAFRQSIFVQLDDTHFQEINSYYHNGATAYLNQISDEAPLQITNRNLRQQKLNSGTDANIMICLNSKWADKIIQRPYEYVYGQPYIADDSRIIELTEQAARRLIAENIFYGKICLNSFRRLEYNDYSGINKIVVIINKNLSAFTDEHREVRHLKQLINEMNALIDRTTFIDNEVKGLDIIYYLTQIATLNNQLISQSSAQLRLQSVSIFYGCASGKNRTGIASYHNICSSLFYYFQYQLNLELNKNIKNHIYQLIGQFHHVQIIAGLGSIFGTEGIRHKSSNSLKWEHSKTLISPLADIKSLPALDANFNVALDRLEAALVNLSSMAPYHALSNLIKPVVTAASKQAHTALFISKVDSKNYKNILFQLEKICIKPGTNEMSECLLGIKNILTELEQTNDQLVENSIKSIVPLLNNIVSHLTTTSKYQIRDALAQHGTFSSQIEISKAAKANEKNWPLSLIYKTKIT